MESEWHVEKGQVVRCFQRLPLEILSSPNQNVTTAVAGERGIYKAFIDMRLRKPIDKWNFAPDVSDNWSNKSLDAARGYFLFPYSIMEQEWPVE